MEERNRKDGSTLDEGSGLARTFKEVVREEHGEGKEVNWKSFRDGIRIHNAGNAWAAAVAEGANGRPRAGIGSLSRTSSMRAPQNSHAWVGGGFNEERDEAVAALLQQRPPPTKEQPMKMSLMALLADNGGYSDGDEDADDDEGNEGGVAGKKEKEGFNDEDETENEGEMMHACCVCMVRHKGAAFIPCGHTFCRLCSRELWVSRGNCPLCNGFILEILDIF